MVSFAAEPIFKLGFFNVTNAFLDTLLVDGLLVGLMVVINKKISLIPGKIQNLIEMAIEALYDITESVAAERAPKIFPYLMSFFLFILLANWSGLIPGISAIGLKEGHEIVPFLRPATSDLNTTLALALISLVATHVMSIKTTGLKDYVSRFVSLNPINLYVGILELVGEFTKIVSLSFRLFGNVFAGEVLLTIISFLAPYFIPLPFMFLELFVGIIQAFIFAMITLVSISLHTATHESH